MALNLFRNLRYTVARTLAPDVFKRRYDAAAGGRRWAHHPHFGRANTEALQGGPAILSRARHAVANNCWATNALGVFECSLVGPGIESRSAHPDANVRAAIGVEFKRWTQVADADELTDWFGLQAAIVRALVQDGESFVHIANHEDGPRLRVLPREMIDESRTGTKDAAGNTDVGGVRFNAAGKRVGYWLFSERPQDVLVGASASVLVPAGDVLHVFKTIGPGAVRGVSWFAPVLLALSELDQWGDAQIVNAKQQAMLVAFLVNKNKSTDGPLPDLSHLESGAIVELPGDIDVKFSSPQQMQTAMEFGNFTLRSVAAGLGIPEFLLSGDMRGANYSSMRSALVSFRQRIEQIQFQLLVPQLLRPVWSRVVTWLILSGRIQAADFESNREAWLSADYYPPAAPWVDPLKDAQAQREMIDGGLMSRRQAVAALGYDVEQVDAERAADAERERTLGLQSAPRTPQQPQPPQEKDDE